MTTEIDLLIISVGNNLEELQSVTSEQRAAMVAALPAFDCSTDKKLLAVCKRIASHQII